MVSSIFYDHNKQIAGQEDVLLPPFLGRGKDTAQNISTKRWGVAEHGQHCCL